MEERTPLGSDTHRNTRWQPEARTDEASCLCVTEVVEVKGNVWHFKKGRISRGGISSRPQQKPAQDEASHWRKDWKRGLARQIKARKLQDDSAGPSAEVVGVDFSTSSASQPPANTLNNTQNLPSHSELSDAVKGGWVSVRLNAQTEDIPTKETILP